MSRKAFTLIELLVVVAIIGLMAAILFPVMPHRRSRWGARTSACQSNLKQIALAFKQYQQDWDERLPLVAVAAKGNWSGSLQPYLKSWQIFQCPSAVLKTPKTTDYFFNARVAGVNEATVASSTQTILAGDGTDDSATSYALSALPATWLSDGNSPAQRHLEGANYAFVDGHVKWFKPAKLKAPLRWNP